MGGLAVMVLPKASTSLFTPPNPTKSQRRIGARRNTFLRSLFHMFRQQSCVRRPACHDAYSKRPRGDAAVQQRKHCRPLTSGLSNDLPDAVGGRQTQRQCENVVRGAKSLASSRSVRIIALNLA